MEFGNFHELKGMHFNLVEVARVLVKCSYMSQYIVERYPFYHR